MHPQKTQNTLSGKKKGKRIRQRKKRKREVTLAENLSQKTSSRPSPLYKLKSSQNCLTFSEFSEDTKKIGTRVRKNKIKKI